MIVLNALRYEFVRIRSLRSTWLLLVIGPVLQFLIALNWAAHHDMTPAHRFTSSFIGVLLVLVVLPCVAIAVGAFGQEYRFRTITTTTLTLRTPGRILGAKAVVVGLLGAVSGLAVVAVTLLAEELVGGVPTDAGVIGQALVGSVLFAMLSCLVGLGVAEVSRNGTIALVTMIGFPAIIETVLELAKAPSWLLPFRDTALALTTSDPDRWILVLPLLAVTVALLGASWVGLRRRDT